MPPLVFLVAGWLGGGMLATLAHGATRAGAPALDPVSRVGMWLVAAAASLLLCRRARVRCQDPAGPPHSVTLLASVAVGLVAALVADGLLRERARCLRALGDPDARLLALVHDAVEPGSWVRATARGAAGPLRACRTPASLSVRTGEAPAGAWVAVQGLRLRSGASLRVDDAELAPTAVVDWMHGWRGRTGVTIDSLFRNDAPLVRALLVADQQGIAPEVRDRFASAGLVHVLSISGLHVAIIATALRILAAAARLRRTASDVAAFAGVAAYVALLGFPAPATRASVMLLTMLLARQLDRPVHPWTALALGVAIPAFDPTVVATLGWQLSASGMAALVGARGLLRRWRIGPAHGDAADGGGRRSRGLLGRALHLRELHGWRLAITRDLMIGSVASVVTAPLVAWAFGRVSLVAPFANLVAGPVVTFLQPTLFLALLLAPLGAPAAWVADAAGVPLVVLDHIARLAADVPFAALEVAPGRLTALCAGVMVAAFVVSTARRRVMPPLLVGGTALVVAIWAPVLARGSGTMELHVVDVGQGDALALRTPRGRWVLIDAGRAWQGGDAGRRTVVPYVRRRGGDVALFVLTHPDADHVGGAPSVLEALRPARWWDPGFVHGSDVYRDALAVADARGIPWHRAQAGDSITVDGVLLRVLGPDSAWTVTHGNANDASVVLMVHHGRIRMLLTGDAEAAEEEWLVARWGDALAAHVLKVGHHGSRTSSTTPFLDRVRPAIALVSVGAENRYGHPAPDVMARLRARQVDVLRTDRDGAIVVRSDGRDLQLETRFTAWTHALP